MKKTLILTLILMLSISLLAGCGGGTDSAAPADSAAQEKPATAEAPADAANGVDMTLVKELEQKNIKLVEVYNEVAPLAVDNGWNKDETTAKEIAAAQVLIETFNSIILDPSSAEGADLVGMLKDVDDFIKELDTNFRAKVSSPYTGK